jgi:hypothetical protein
MDTERQSGGVVETEWVTTNLDAPGLVRPTLKGQCGLITDFRDNAEHWMDRCIPREFRSSFFFCDGQPGTWEGRHRPLCLKLNPWRIGYSRSYAWIISSKAYIVESPEELRKALGLPQLKPQPPFGNEEYVDPMYSKQHWKTKMDQMDNDIFRTFWSHMEDAYNPQKDKK